MKTKHIRSVIPGLALPAQRSRSGFSLIELMVAMAVFLVIGGAAVSLVSSHAKLSTTTQRQVELNMTLRNAVSMMEVDASNAGAGFFSTGTNPTDFPVGVTLKNQPQGGPACNAGTTYNAGCFDILNIITTDSTVPPSHPAFDVDTNAVTTAQLTPPPPMTSATFALLFKSGDELLWLKPGSPKGTITTTTLTADGKDLGGTVQLTFNKTIAVAGIGNSGANPNEAYWITNDPNGTNGLQLDTGDPSPLAHNFSAGIDWVLKLNAITYFVDTTVPTNPRLMRKQGLGPGAADEVAQQIIGFRVGASIRHGVAGADQLYSFNSNGTTVANGCTSNCGYKNDWTEIRALRISVLGRTSPSTDVNNHYKNTYDQGPYKIEGISVTINPRNLSMNDL
ncbi:MAG TPA: prepilin-type N-terminal cleavage/methylation domain-containing protein [Candidatus Angelobacter sp.]|jgi:prepilin-type N-terminal cleavage/methylation domain-containing protein|nr:prepilin-type N-terminal cleavage/methylation domain-containing protein [Candidatus Angelobacter sp.]